ncbi:MAG: hypothetical protein OEM32_06240, partial [Acidimicrobiia bacterium]|nr:hypothetical protein [Acidimicrobiia bacterium]
MSVYLYWIPLGAGGAGFVRFNGRVYESVQARRHGRTPLDLYHTALNVHAPEGRFIIENAWPIPDANTAHRGVVVEGPVFSRWISSLRVFRYEVRCWRDGVIQDSDEAVGGARPLDGTADLARSVLDLVRSVPPMVWGRDQQGAGEMWNSNSVISWLLTNAGADMSSIRPP